MRLSQRKVEIKQSRLLNIRSLRSSGLSENARARQESEIYLKVTLLSDPTEIPPYRETGVAIPPSHCVFCGIADYRCYTPTSFLKNGLSQSEDRPNKGGIAEKLTCEGYRATGGVARNSGFVARGKKPERRKLTN